jgi:hypothetical protein
MDHRERCEATASGKQFLSGSARTVTAFKR